MMRIRGQAVGVEAVVFPGNRGISGGDHLPENENAQAPRRGPRVRGRVVPTTKGPKLRGRAETKLPETQKPSLGPRIRKRSVRPELKGGDLQEAGDEQKSQTDQELTFTLRQQAAEARAKLHELCRSDVNTFCEYVLTDDESGMPVEQSPFHVEIQDSLTKFRQLVIMSHPESGKTQQVAVGRVLWELGRNPNLRVMLLYNAEESAIKTLASLRRYIESSAELHAVFPALKRGEVWKDDAIIVQRTSYSRDPSVSAVGYNSRRIVGSRIDMLVIDDLLESSNTSTEQQRRKLSGWVKNPVLNRLADGALVALLTNAWHPRDLAHELVRERGWKMIRRPIRNEDGQIWWHRWSEERLKLQRKTLGALEYARSFECDPRDDGSRVFRPEHVDAALNRGKGVGFIQSMELMPEQTIIVSGIDVAAGDDTKRQGAKTVITSIFFHPNQHRQIIRIRSGRWRARQILAELATVGHLFPNQHWIVVETNNVQRWLLDLAKENDMDIGVALVPFLTGKNKRDPVLGVASMAAEFEGNKWTIPSSCLVDEEQGEVEAAVSQIIDYVPEAHTGDHLMSIWLAREVGRDIFRRLFGKKRQQHSNVRMIG